MKSIDIVIRTLLVAGAMACFPATFAQAGEMPPAPGMELSGSRGPGFLHGLALNEVQRDEVFAIQHEQAPVIRQKTKSIHATQEALRGLARSNRFDEVRARALADAAAKEMAELAMLRARADQMIYALLTVEQRKQLEDMRAGRSEAARHRDLPR